MSRYHHAPRSTTRRTALRRAIARSGAACHICGKPIDYDLPSTDPLSFEVDHLVPLAKGGSDTLANARAAHRTCNRAKGAANHAPIVRRAPIFE